MPIDVSCGCGKHLVALDGAAGKRAKCPACGAALVVPALPSVAESRPPPAAVDLGAMRQGDSASAESDDIDDDYRVAPLLPPPLPLRDFAAEARALAIENEPPIMCPSCQRSYPSNAKLCVPCGIDLQSGRSLRTSQAIDEEELYARMKTIAQGVSWVVPFGLFPIASDAYGKFKPYAIWSLAAANAFFTLLFWLALFHGGNNILATPFWSSLMMWTGTAPGALDGPTTEFHLYQLVTNTFLHGGIMHLVGNMIFLIVFGGRINAMLGQRRTLVLYLLLAVAASLVFLISQIGQPIVPALGASGAIMGLAGMYFVLLPTSRVHMVCWLRLGLLLGFECPMKCFCVRGIWVLMFYLSFDIFATQVGSRDGTAHWAHLGGFICGMIAGFVLLLTDQIDARGCDILSFALGRRAWKILGTPAERAAKQEA